MAKLRPGNFKLLEDEDWADYDGSLAAAIETELNDLLALDGLPKLPLDTSDSELRDRRRLFVAIARAVVRHFVDNPDAFDVTVPPHATVHPVIHWSEEP
jgi:hypothetical protein